MKVKFEYAVTLGSVTIGYREKKYTCNRNTIGVASNVLDETRERESGYNYNITVDGHTYMIKVMLLTFGSPLERPLLNMSCSILRKRIPATAEAVLAYHTELIQCITDLYAIKYVCAYVRMGTLCYKSYTSLTKEMANLIYKTATTQQYGACSVEYNSCKYAITFYDLKNGKMQVAVSNNKVVIQSSPQGIMQYLEDLYKNLVKVRKEYLKNRC